MGLAGKAGVTEAALGPILRPPAMPVLPGDQCCGQALLQSSSRLPNPGPPLPQALTQLEQSLTPAPTHEHHLARYALKMECDVIILVL